ncbi:MAG: AAA family ATPase [Phycisphaerae bacterium]
MNALLKSLRLRGLLSFSPASQTVKLGNLNVLIGPNGVGKSNFIEALELLKATPTDLSAVIRIGGTPSDWIWRGKSGLGQAGIDAVLGPVGVNAEHLYVLEFADSGGRLEITNEALEDWVKTDPAADDVRFYYRFQAGRPVIRVTQNAEDPITHRRYLDRFLKRENIDPQQSVLSQMKDPDTYPEITTTARRFGGIQIFREWGFGRSAALRAPQSANLPTDVLLPQLVNLGLVLNNLEHNGALNRFNSLMRKFLPRYARLSTKVLAGSVQIYLHEDGLESPVPATRLSDGTLRFLALLAILLNAESSPLICIEEPELGLHPDAMSILAELLVEASEKTQIIVTTHSDALVSAFTEKTDSVLVCDYLENGTELRRLDAEKLAHWLKDYRLGDLWRTGKLGGNLW